METMPPSSHCFFNLARSLERPCACRCMTQATSLSASSTVRRGSSTKPFSRLVHRDPKSAISDSENKSKGSGILAFSPCKVSGCGSFASLSPSCGSGAMSKRATLAGTMYAFFIVSSAISPRLPFNSRRHLDSLRCVHFCFDPRPHTIFVQERQTSYLRVATQLGFREISLCGNSNQHVRTLELGLHLAHLLPALACERSALVKAALELTPSRFTARYPPMCGMDVSFEHLSRLSEGIQLQAHVEFLANIRASFFRQAYQ